MMNYTRSDKYSHLFTKEYLMGPNCLRLADELLEHCPVPFGGRVADIGSGTGMVSLFVAKEREASVLALDLWSDPTENLRRMEAWGVGDKVLPVKADASQGLPFGNESFDGVISVDSYHYFACKEGFFTEKILPLVKPGGAVLIAVPGLKEEKAPSPVMLEWGGEEDCATFHSCAWWEKTLGVSPEEGEVHTWQMECNDTAWREWFLSGHEYGLRDEEYIKKGAAENMTLIGICVVKKPAGK